MKLEGGKEQFRRGRKNFAGRGNGVEGPEVGREDSKLE